MVEYLVDLLTREGWIVEAEFTFNDYGDRGSVDLLAWQPGRRALLIVEVKTSLTDLQAMLMSLSRKAYEYFSELVLPPHVWKPFILPHTQKTLCGECEDM